MRQFAARVEKLSEQQADKALETLRRVGHLVEGAARDRTPVDEGVLTGDVKSEVQTDEGVQGAVVYVPLNAPSHEYAVKMHEGTYNLGEKSMKKQDKVGVTVGMGFITRAIDDSRDEIKGIMKEELGL